MEPIQINITLPCILCDKTHPVKYIGEDTEEIFDCCDVKHVYNFDNNPVVTVTPNTFTAAVNCCLNMDDRQYTAGALRINVNIPKALDTQELQLAIKLMK
jgi:hypothetical protein